MIEGLEVRTCLSSDMPSIDTLYPDAFPDEDLLPLVQDLLTLRSVTLSLVGIVDRTLAGHVVFTACSIAGTEQKISLLGPLAVAPAWQSKGIGSALVREGLQQVAHDGAVRACVLGDPAYYGRFGFAPEADIMPPYPLPTEWTGAWQSVSLHNTEPPPHGTLTVPEAWRQPALWAP